MADEEKLAKLQEAVQWVLSDMGYKAPETYPQAIRVWWTRLATALKESKE